MSEWRAEAVCRQLVAEGRAEVDWWFYGPRQGVRNHRQILEPRVVTAMRVCSYCPVAAECLAEAFSWGETLDQGTIRGGLTAGQRHSIRRGRSTVEVELLKAARQVGLEVA